MKELVKVYLSGAMEKISENENFHGVGWRKIVKEALDNTKFEIFDPYDFERPIGLANDKYNEIQIVEGDKLCIMKSDIFIVNTGHEGVGTPMETLFAWEQGKRIYGFGGSQNPWYTYHIHNYFNKLDDLIVAVKRCGVNR